MGTHLGGAGRWMAPELLTSIARPTEASDTEDIVPHGRHRPGDGGSIVDVSSRVLG